jgi:type IX secretion system PorP/SprF family membrane protein
MKSITYVCICFIPIMSKAQQLPLLSYYREHHALLNPATLYYENYTSSNRPEFSVGASYRQQWLGVNDAPQTMTVRFEHILSDQNMVYGASFLRDAIGVTDLTGGYTRYAYQLKNDNNFISAGLSFGFFQYRYKPWEGKIKQPNDIVAGTPYSEGVFDVSLGIFGNLELREETDMLYMGASIPQVYALNFANNSDNPIARYKHYYFLIGYYHFFEKDPDFVSFIEPSLWVRYVPNIPIQLDANMRVNIRQFWFGGGMAMSPIGDFQFDVIHTEAGIRLPLGSNGNTLKIGYGFDITTNKASVRLGATHEINLVYSWAR